MADICIYPAKKKKKGIGAAQLTQLNDDFSFRLCWGEGGY